MLAGSASRSRELEPFHSPHNAVLALPLVILVGFVLGALAGRWWALLAPAAFGVYVGFVAEVEVPAWFLGLMYGALAAAVVAAGVLVRRFANRKANPS